MLRSEGSRDEGRGKRQKEGVGRVNGKVCFGFLLLEDPCPSDYAHGQRYSVEIQETPHPMSLTKRHVKVKYVSVFFISSISVKETFS